VGDDVPVDSEAHVVTSSISRPDLPAQSFRDAHKGSVCVHAFIGVSVCERLRLYYVSQKKSFGVLFITVHGQENLNLSFFSLKYSIIRSENLHL
jgi:hypothetical protein